ncbi:MAG: hypothetical protein II622_05385, partial [Thermoguttaceae bacterium]|nr:hypothetical protein [Thermoguttaceae bacterium]
LAEVPEAIFREFAFALVVSFVGIREMRIGNMDRCERFGRADVQFELDDVETFASLFGESFGESG